MFPYFLNIDLQRSDAFTQAGKLFQTGCVFLPARIRIKREHAGVMPRLQNGPGHHRGCRNVHMVGQRQVPQHHRPAPHGAMGTDARAARHPHTAGHGGVRTDVHVVADLNQVVEFDAVFNHGVVQRAAVNASVGADFHIVADAHRPQLFNFFPLPLVQGKTKTVSADHDPRMQDTTRPHRAAFRQSHTRLQD